MTTRKYSVDVCIVGGGPAGMILGLLLAKQGVKVLVLELHKDFEREYRGEVLMPRFTQMMKQVNLFSYIEQFPHLKLEKFNLYFKEKVMASITLSQLSPDAPFAMWMPQPVLLNALYQKAKTFSNFEVLFGTMARDLIKNDGVTVGVIAEQEGERVEIAARVTIGADGRNSVVRKAGEFEFEYEAHNFDIIWFTFPRPKEDENTVRAFFSPKRRYVVLPKYPDALQCGLIVPAGEFTEFRKRGILSLQKEILSAHPVMHNFARNLKDFSPFNVLPAKVSFVKQWAKDGCLLIGDAAHTCSPVGAIGVAVATGTAIVAADVLIKALKTNDVSVKTLSRVQEIRTADVKKIQRFQGALAGALFISAPIFQWISIKFITLFGRMGILIRIQRQIAVMEKLLPIDPKLGF